MHRPHLCQQALKEFDVWSKPMQTIHYNYRHHADGSYLTAAVVCASSPSSNSCDMLCLCSRFLGCGGAVTTSGRAFSVDGTAIRDGVKNVEQWIGEPLYQNYAIYAKPCHLYSHLKVNRLSSSSMGTGWPTNAVVELELAGCSPASSTCCTPLELSISSPGPSCLILWTRLCPRLVAILPHCITCGPPLHLTTAHPMMPFK